MNYIQLQNLRIQYVSVKSTQQVYLVYKRLHINVSLYFVNAVFAAAAADEPWRDAR